MRTYLRTWLERQPYRILKSIYPNIPDENRITEADKNELYEDWCNSTLSWRDEMYLRHHNT